MRRRGSFLAYLIACCAGWIQRQQAGAIEYLIAENRTLRNRLGGPRLIFTEAERRLLARKAFAVGRRRLRELDPVVTPDTLLRWHRELVARKCVDIHAGLSHSFPVFPRNIDLPNRRGVEPIPSAAAGRTAGQLRRENGGSI